MIKNRLLAAALSLFTAYAALSAAPALNAPAFASASAVLAGPAAAAAPAGVAVPAALAGSAAAAAPACPVVKDHLEAALDRDIPLGKITPKPFWRKSCGTLYRSDGRGPDVIFAQGFAPKNATTGQYDIEKYVLENEPSPYVSTTYDHDLYKSWDGAAFNYYVDAPGGIDVNKTIGSKHKYAAEHEVAFPGGILTKYIIGACPVDKTTRTEIMDHCRSNPHYKPWH